LLGVMEAVEGIEEAYSDSKYQITITRGLAFDWNDVQVAVIAALADPLGFVADEAWRMDDIEARGEVTGEVMPYDC
jgi:hypothetical protein